MKRVAVITSSDKGYRGEREDLSGPAVKEIMEAAGYEVVSVDHLRMYLCRSHARLYEWYAQYP